ncbi:MAG: hypothetical protein IPJ15_16495 [Actinomycetales bacterium]|nr:hypothetical protein [Candidatus Phosphoribacter baldrii]
MDKRVVCREPHLGARPVWKRTTVCGAGPHPVGEGGVAKHPGRGQCRRAAGAAIQLLGGGSADDEVE